MYGNPTTVKQYADNAQLINADSYRAMFEAANHRMWDITSGVMLWKLNSCWPDVGWQIYDWFLNPGAAYFFSKKAMEPLHIQMNANNRQLMVINATHQSRNGLHIEAQIIDYNMNVIWSYVDTVSVQADSYRECPKIPKPTESSPIYFVKLTLREEGGQLISDNLYWQCAQHEDFSMLAALAKVKLKKTVTIVNQGNELRIEVNLKNETRSLSFFNRLILRKDNSGDEVLPTFWSDNYVTLFPGEEKTIVAIVANSDFGGVNPVIDLE